MKLRPEQSEAMFNIAGVHKESLDEALRKLGWNPYYPKVWSVEDPAPVASMIVSCLLYCYVPGLPEGIEMVYLMSEDGGPHWFVAYTKEEIQHFDPAIHIEQAYEGVQYVIIDLLRDSGREPFRYELGRIVRGFSEYWPPMVVQFLAQLLGYNHEAPTRKSGSWTPNPEVAAERVGSTKGERTLA